MMKLIQALIAILLLMLITILGLHLFENFKGEDPISSDESISSNEVDGVIDQTLNYGSYSKAAKFSSVIATLTLLKQQVAMFYAQSGNWPESLVDIGLSENELTSEKYIDSILIQEGAIYANIASEFDSGATVRLMPSEGMGGATIKWLCETNLVLKQVNYCRFNSDLVYP